MRPRRRAPWAPPMLSLPPGDILGRKIPARLSGDEASPVRLVFSEVLGVNASRDDLVYVFHPSVVGESFLV